MQYWRRYGITAGINVSWNEGQNERVSVEVYNRLKQCGKIVKLYFLEGADHGGSEFWTEEMQQIIIQFMEEK